MYLSASKPVSSDEPMRCFFCGKKANAAGKLISNPSSTHRVCICDECVRVCLEILEDDRPENATDALVKPETPHPLLSHPLASELMDCVAEWIRQESLGADASAAFGRLRSVAERMVRAKTT
jgi:hypothetical protein